MQASILLFLSLFVPISTCSTPKISLFSLVRPCPGFASRAFALSLIEDMSFCKRVMVDANHIIYKLVVNGDDLTFVDTH
jgi:hypothetical protein